MSGGWGWGPGLRARGYGGPAHLSLQASNAARVQRPGWPSRGRAREVGKNTEHPLPLEIDSLCFHIPTHLSLQVSNAAGVQRPVWSCRGRACRLCTHAPRLGRPGAEAGEAAWGGAQCGGGAGHQAAQPTQQVRGVWVIYSTGEVGLCNSFAIW